jgi:hypothetical protein
MSDRLHGQHLAHASKWSVLGLALACLLFALGLLAVGCGGGSSDTETTAATSVEEIVTTTTVAAAENVDPTKLGQAIGATWLESMSKLVSLLETKPEMGAVKGDVEQLKEDYIQKLVAYGKQRETLDTAGKAAIDLEVMSAQGEALEAPWYATYTDLTSYYLAKDAEFGYTIQDFNILTQYSFFELLKTQEPEEAARLGIE